MIQDPSPLFLFLDLSLLDLRVLPLFFLDLLDLVLARRDLAIIYYGTKKLKYLFPWD